MTLLPSHPYIEFLRDALRTLESDPGPMIPDKSDLLQQIRKRIGELEAELRTKSGTNG